MRRFLCWLFCRVRKYVAVKHTTIFVGFMDVEAVAGSECRWVCECGRMGTDERRGYYAVEFGQLVPDEKAWANFEAKG